MPKIYSFPPVESAAAKCVILGSMPGKASLSAQQYYAHPRNLFWRFMDTLIQVSASAPYDERCQALVSNGIALWDVLAVCVRPGSLDVDIEASSIVPNDFQRFFETHVDIEQIFFNGAKAEDIFLRHVQPHLPDQFATISKQRLPSTSPANAGIPLAVKLDQWRAITCSA